MMTLPDFEKKQIVFIFLSLGEKISFANDNLVVKTKDDKIKLQTTCYRIFMLCIVGSFTLTTGIIQRSHKFDFPIVLMTSALKVYDKFGSKMEGNVVLRRKQYCYTKLDLAKHIVRNKIENQKYVLELRRKKTQEISDAIAKLKALITDIDRVSDNIHDLLGIEGNAAKIYFKAHFDTIDWRGRKPRIKCDYVNSILDIGYTIAFNLIDSLLSLYGFDVYCGVLHKEFYMRKSLVCDLVETLRPIIDQQVKKSINLKQFQESDFLEDNHCFKLKWDCNKKYVSILLQALLEYKLEIFKYIQAYYRAFMKDKNANEFPCFLIEGKQ